MATSRITGSKKRGRGRPKIGSIQVQVRFPPAELAALDDWIKAQAKPKPSRPEAIRRFAELALKAEKPPAKIQEKDPKSIASTHQAIFDDDEV